MSADNIFEISLKRPLCLGSLSEDDLRTLIDTLSIVPSDSDLANFMKVTGGVDVKMVFDGTGNYSGIFAKINSTLVNLFPGVGSKALQVFAGPVTATNPGVGWKVETDLTEQYFGQSGSSSTWEIFVASRERVINP